MALARGSLPSADGGRVSAILSLVTPMPVGISRLVGSVFVLFAAAALMSCRSASRPDRPAPADLVLRGGRLVTLDDTMPEAGALAARDGRIVALGTAADIAPLIGPATEVIELNAAFAMPGFIEGHGHFTGIGESRLNLDLAGTTSWDGIVGLVAQAIANAKPGQWIAGRGW